MTDGIDALFALLERQGGERYGEDVTQLDHALQVAFLAREGGGDDRFVTAALFHDIGQLVDGAGDAAAKERRDARHEHHGADMLAAYFPLAVTEPVRLHVDAKRYLCAVEPGYHAGLSAASRLSLAYQGGPLDVAACAAFAAGAHGAAAVRLRRLDDAGKLPDRILPPLESYRDTVCRARIDVRD